MKACLKKAAFMQTCITASLHNSADTKKIQTNSKLTYATSPGALWKAGA